MTDGLNPLQRNDSRVLKPVVPQRNTALIHFAGVDIQIGPFLRQRCSWCGAVLIDYNLDRVMVPVGQEPGGPPTWPISALIVVDGPMSTVVEHVDRARLPPGTCADLEWISEAVDGIMADAVGDLDG